MSSRQFGSIDVCNETVLTCSAEEISSNIQAIGGRCNNINNPILGTINRPYRRLLPACDRDIINTRNTLLSIGRDGNHGNGGNSGSHESQSNEESGNIRQWQSPPAGSVQCNTGRILPNTRLVSRTFHSNADVTTNTDQFFTMFGQFVCHDFILTTTQNAVTDCCTSTSQSDYVNCLPIIVPPGDSFFNNNQCLDFKRATVFCNQAGQSRRHINQLTAYIDAGNIYGSDDKTATALRFLSGGLLKDTTPGRLLPKISLVTGGTSKFTAGDGRATENPALATVHTIFLREHNRMATLIAQRNPSLTDDQIYSQARRIVTAEYQNLVFSEFLPVLIGTSNLFPSGDQQTRYKDNEDPSVANELSAAVFRFGHTLVNGFFSQNDPLTGQSLGGYLLRTSNNNESTYSSSPDLGMTSIAKGMTIQAAQAYDHFMTSELTNFLYASATNSFAFGSDLAARNIQRGRDNGLSPWVHYRKVCAGSAPRSWNSRPDDISADNWSKLQALYQKVEDIDLFTGTLAEKSVNKGTLGVTAACLVADQFKRLIEGDRYFFAHQGDVGARFNRAQISALKNVRMFDILCLNTNISRIQKKSFKIANGSNNKMAQCTEAVPLNLALFNL